MAKEFSMKKLFKHWQLVAILLAIYDIFAVSLAYFFALWFRYDCAISEIPYAYLHVYTAAVPVYAVICVVTFWLMPYLFPALAAQALGRPDIRDYDAAVRAVLAAQPVDFITPNFYVSQDRPSIFRNRLMLNLRNDEGIFITNDNEFKIARPDGSHELRTLETMDELKQVLTTYYGIDPAEATLREHF